MRILTLVWSIGIGGTERAAVNYAIAYQQAAMDSRVLVLGEGLERKPDLVHASVTVYSLPHESPSVLDLISEWQADIIQIHNFSVELYEYIKILRAPHTKIVHTNVFSRPYYLKEYAIVDASLQLTNWGLWKFQRMMKPVAHPPLSRVVPYLVLENGFKKPAPKDVKDFISAVNIPDDAFIVGRIGQPLMSKWDSRIIDVVIQTITENNNIYYLFVGLPSELKERIAGCTQLVRSRVRMIDKISGDERLSLFYHSLSVFAHISKIGESFGYVLTEAMICNVPVVTMLTPFKDNGQYEVVGHNIGGLCVTNKAQYIRAILKLHDDRQLYASIRAKQIGWVEQRFAPDAVLPGLLNFYQELLAGNAKQEYFDDSKISEQLKLYKFSGIFRKLIEWKNSPFAQKLIDLINR